MKIPAAILIKVKPFTLLGVDFTDISDKQVIGTCPFSNTERKFFVNYTNLLWDSKSAGLSGDIHDFFKYICERNEELAMPTVKILELARHRGLPVEAFEGYGLGWDGEKYTMPIYDARGKVTDVRRYYMHKKKLKPYGMPKGKVGMFNADALNDPQLRSEPIFVCEGEWDAIALNWLLRKNKADGFAIGVPGANTFKIIWAELFAKRDVTLCYDNDHAGAAGEQVALRRLEHTVQSIAFIRWPDELDEGFDVRDWVSNGHKRKIFRKSLDKFLDLARATPRIAQADDVDREKLKAKRKRVIKNRAKHQDLFKIFCEHLQLDSEDTLAVIMSTILVNRLPGDPLWLLVVGASGAGKTEYLATLENYDECVFTAEFTPHTLVSGMPSASGRDPSLLPKLDGKVLVIKDFTVILSMHPTGRDEIFGQLREAYDGTYTKQFGNGLVRKYESSFGLIAGVTPRIDEYTSLHAGLGERFVKYRLPNPKLKMEKDIIMSAIFMAGKEDGMRVALKEAVTHFLDNTPDDEPEIDEQTAHVITSIALVISRLRGSVVQNEYTGIQHSRATHEMGTRLAKQLVRLWKGLSIYFHTDKHAALRITRKVARGSVVDKRDEVIKIVCQLSAGKSRPSTSDVAAQCRGLSQPTVHRELQDLQLLDVVTSRKIKAKNARVWAFSESFKKLLDASSLYD